MSRLRQARFLVRLVLAWFALSLGVAVASPIVQPQAAELVCSGGAMKLLLQGDAEQPPSAHTLECPLCTTAGAPPPASRADAGLAVPTPHVLQPVPAARLAARTAAPLPARGPPALLPT